VLLGLFFITVGMLLDVGLLLRDLPVVTAILLGMLLLKAAIVTVVAKPATRSWFKSLRTGLIVAQGGEFGFALLILLLRRELLDSGVVQPLLAATVLSMVLSPLIIRHNRRITRIILRESGNPLTEAMREERITLACRGSGACGDLRLRPRWAEHRAQCWNKPASNTSHSMWIRTAFARAAKSGIRWCTATPVKARVLENVGVAHASVVVITFANPDVALRILRSVRELRPDVPILVRTQDDTKWWNCRRPAQPRWCRKRLRPASCCSLTCCCW